MDALALAPSDMGHHACASGFHNNATRADNSFPYMEGLSADACSQLTRLSE